MTNDEIKARLVDVPFGFLASSSIRHFRPSGSDSFVLRHFLQLRFFD
jgi:hypothetical protein